MIIERLQTVGFPIHTVSMTAGEVLGIDEFNVSDDGLETDRAVDADDPKFSNLFLLPKKPRGRRATYSVDDLDLDHIEGDVRERVREMLSIHSDMWNRSLWCDTRNIRRTVVSNTNWTHMTQWDSHSFSIE